MLKKSLKVMRVLNDFECPSGHVTEHFVDSEATSVRCECGLEATKKLSGVTFKADIGKNATTKSILQWAKKRERKLKQERKASYSE